MLDTIDPAQLIDVHLSAYSWSSLPQGALVTLTLPFSCPSPFPLPVNEAPLAYLARPDRGEYRLGVGVALMEEVEGHARLETLSRRFAELANDWVHIDPEGCGITPGAFVAWAFDPGDPMLGAWRGFPNAALYVPEILLYHSTDGQCMVSFTATAGESPTELARRWSAAFARLLAVREEADAPPLTLRRLSEVPSAAKWQALVKQALDQLAVGDLQKLVPARRIEVEASRPLHWGRLMQALIRLYPECSLLGFRLGGRSLVAASPERLLSMQDRILRVDALAGTAPRSNDPDRDRQLAAALQSDPKAEREHRVVAQSVCEVLKPLVESLDCPPQPDLMRLRNLQHLHTAIEGTVKNDANLLDVAARLHPTPAVAGTPTDAAREWLRQNEELGRGWYSGATGWLDVAGNGELSVILRCALLEGSRAELYAGAGVVNGSEPAQELSETELKFDSMLEALQHA